MPWVVKVMFLLLVLQERLLMFCKNEREKNECIRLEYVAVMVCVCGVATEKVFRMHKERPTNPNT